MNNPQAFYHRLKQAREEHGMTQVDAAKHLKIARQTYLDLENGRTQPRLDTLLEFALQIICTSNLHDQWCVHQ